MKSRFAFHYEISGRKNVGRGTVFSCGVDELIFMIHYMIPKIFYPFDEAYEKKVYKKAIEGENK
jgi:hypothetical protein